MSFVCSIRRSCLERRLEEQVSHLPGTNFLGCAVGGTMKPSLKGRKYISIDEAARHMNVAFLDLVEWLRENQTQVYAHSEYADVIQPVDPIYAARLLATKRTFQSVRFLYSKSLQCLRLKSSGVDDQEICRDDLELSVKDVLKFRDQIVQIYEPLTVEDKQKHGTKNKNVGLNARGHQFKKNRKLIEDQVAKLLKELDPKLSKKNGELHIEKMTEHLYATRETWLGDKSDDHGFGFDNIKMAVRKIASLKKS